MGDGVMGFFGAPLNDIDHADKAVALALRLDQVCTEFQQELLLENVAVGRTRIGVHSGAAIVGNFGGTRFFDYTAHGDTVNTAARLESANKILGSCICVSGDTARRAVHHSFRPVGQLQLFGKKNLLDAWEPLPEDMSYLAPLEDYESAYRQLEHESEDSLQVFARLSNKYPNDHLVSFHLDRLNNNGHGTQFETSK
jgi:adenylate cyclase